MTIDEIKNGGWFVDLLMALKPDANIKVTGTPDEMIAAAAKEAFWVSTGAGAFPGPLGLLTILPELIAVTKIQVNLIYRIAKYYGQITKVNTTIVALIIGNSAGVCGARTLAAKVGRTTFVKKVTGSVLREILRRIGVEIGTRTLQRMVGRWIPILLAPVFGAFSKSMTTKIGQEAKELFSTHIEMEE